MFKGNFPKVILVVENTSKRWTAFLKSFFVVLILVSLSAVPAYSAINQQINYQAKLTDSGGSAVTDDDYSVVFSLYTASTGGSAIWTETQTVSTESGLFSVMLGSVSSLASVDFNQTLYLGINVEADGEMSPRKILGAVPAAFEAKQLEGLTSSQFLRSDTNNDDATFTNSTSTNATSTTLAVSGTFNFLGTAITNVSTWFNGLFDTQLGTKDSDDLTEGVTNLYFTTDRLASGLQATTTDALAEGVTNLYYTDTRARASISESITGIDYDNGTGVFSLTADYNVPLTASTTNWNTFYDTPSNRITAGTGLSWSSNTLNAEVQSSDLSAYLLNTGDTATGDYTFDTDTFFIDSSGDRIGIGTTTPGYKLDVSGASDPTIAVTDTTNDVVAGMNASDTYGLFGTLSNHSLFLVQNSSVALTIDTDRDVGIGTTTPTGKLSIELDNTNTTNTNGAGSIVKLSNPNASGQNVIYSEINGTLVSKWRTDYLGGTNWVSNGANSFHTFYTGGDYGVGDARLILFNNGAVALGGAMEDQNNFSGARMYIDDAGLVGVATNDPQARLDVLRANNAITYTVTPNQLAIVGAAGNESFDLTSSYIDAGANPRIGGLFVSNTETGSNEPNIGVVGIGNPRGGSALANGYGGVFSAVSGNSAASNYGLYVKNVSGGASNYGIYIEPSVDNYFAGNVGVATTTPGDWFGTEKLAVSGGLLVDGHATSTGTITAGSGQQMKIGSWSTTPGTYAAIANSQVFDTAGSYALIQSSTGQTYLNAASGSNINLRVGNGSSDVTFTGSLLDIDTDTTIDGVLTVSNTSGGHSITRSSTGASPVLTVGGTGVATGGNSRSILNVATSDNTATRYTAVFDGGGGDVYIESTGNVGIGTATPGRTLDVVGTTLPFRARSTNGDLVMADTQISYTTTTTADTSQFLLVDQDNSSTRAVLDVQGNAGANQVLYAASNGSVGIGTATPAQRLHLYTSGAGSNRLRIENSEGYYDLLTDGNEFSIFNSSGSTVFNVDTSGNLDLTAASTITYGDAGALGTATIQIGTPDAGDDNRYCFVAGGSCSSSRGAYLLFHGNEYSFGSRYGSIFIEAGNTSNGGDIFLNTNATTRLNVSYAGNVGIGLGTTDASNKLEVSVGSVSANTVAGSFTGGTSVADRYVSLEVENTASDGYSAFQAVGGTASAWFGVNSQSRGVNPGDAFIVNTTNNDILFSTSTGEIARFKAGGTDALVVGGDHTVADDVKVAVQSGAPAIQFTETDESGSWYAGVSSDAFYITESGSIGVKGGAGDIRMKVDSNGYLTVGDLRTSGGGTAGVCFIGTGNHEITDCSGAPSDLAEWYETDGDVSEGDIVMVTDNIFEYKGAEANPFTYEVEEEVKDRSISVLAKATDKTKVVGVVSSDPYQVMGEEIRDQGENPLPVALSGRVPVKVNLDGGNINPGDQVTLSDTPGVGKKSSSPDDMIVGIALAKFNKSSPQTGGIGQVMIMTNLRPARLTVSDLSNPVSSEVGLNSMTINSLLNLNGHSITNVKAIQSLSNTWSISADGVLTVKKLRTDSLEVGEGKLNSGVTLFDRNNGKPYCVFVKNGVIKTEDGRCGENESESSNQESSSGGGSSGSSDDSSLDVPSENNEAENNESEETEEEVSDTETVVDGDSQNQEETTEENEINQEEVVEENSEETPPENPVEETVESEPEQTEAAPEPENTNEIEPPKPEVVESEPESPENSSDDNV